ncbi:MAG: hypothetical protein AAB426_07450, partial [Myxococcota bacterium]
NRRDPGPGELGRVDRRDTFRDEYGRAVSYDVAIRAVDRAWRANGKRPSPFDFGPVPPQPRW